MSIFQIILTSTITASLVSGLVLLVNSWIERKERRKDTLFKTAYQVAKDRYDSGLALAEKMGRSVELRDPIFLAKDYYPFVKSLYDHGELPKSAKETDNGKPI